MASNNYAEKIIHGTYFPHIDGIRALAILPVLLYHIFAKLCPGGFAGVDVFFVISGYLITGGILRDLRNNRFSFMDFYHRRIRRIMPAYFAMIAGVFATGCIFYYSTLLKNLGDASVMGSLFSANFYYWLIGGSYFSPNVKDSPLLHLWSLSIEEQFYLFIPLLCFLIWKYRPRWIAPSLLIITAISLNGAIYAISIGKQNAVFYFLHYRAWELLAGSLLAMIPAISTKPPQQQSRLFASLSWAGILLVLAPYAFLSSTIPFPGLAAIPSVVGTVLLIRYGQFGWLNKLLSSPPLVGTGKISYSLYLWHWPVIVFWKYITYNQLVVWDYVGMFALSLVLGYLSWRFIEIPVRTSQFWSKKRTFAFAASGIAALVFIGTLTVFNNGWPEILHKKANALVVPINQQRPGFLAGELIPRIARKTKLVEHIIPDDLLAKQKSWLFAFGGTGNHQLGNGNKPEILLIGDCHAGSLNYGLNKCLNERDISGISLSYSDTPVFYIWMDARAQEVRSFLAAHPEINKVIVIQKWILYSNDIKRYPDMNDKLDNFVTDIANSKRKIYILADYPAQQNPDLQAKLQIISPRRMEYGWNGLADKDNYDKEMKVINSQLEKSSTKAGATYVPLHLAFLQQGNYVAFERKNGSNVHFYRDTNHLTPAGSLRAARFIMNYIYPDVGNGTTKDH